MATENVTENNTEKAPLKVVTKFKFRKPIMFENKEYSEIDLSGLEDLTGKDMINIEKRLRQNNVNSINCEQSVEACIAYAAQASKLPEEFFDAMPGTEFRRVKNTVLNFFMYM